MNQGPPKFIWLFLSLFACVLVLFILFDDGKMKLTNYNIYQFQRRKEKSNRYLSYPDSLPFSLDCNTCAYITGSGHMTDCNKGKEIDSHDCVIRSNDSPTNGYEKDVGRKTTIRVVGPRSLGIVLKREPSSFDRNLINTTFLLHTFPGWKGMDDPKELIGKLKSEFPNTTVFLYNSSELNRLQKGITAELGLKSQTLISNAIYALQFMHNVCRKLDVYGITYAEYCNQRIESDTPYHYYGTSKAPECAKFSRSAASKGKAHRYLKEKKLFQVWRDEWKNLNFHCPTWPNR